METRFRPSTAEDIDIAVPLIYSSGPAQFRYVFSVNYEDQALDFLRYSFVRGNGQFGFRNHTTVLADNQPVGIGALWTSNSNVGFFICSVVQIFAFYGLINGIKVSLRGLRIESVVKPAAKNKAYLGHLGIHEKLRGKGLGRQLVGYFLKDAKNRGLSRASLDVESDNRRAKKLYQGLGFIDVNRNASSLKNTFGYVLDHFYMEAEL